MDFSPPTSNRAYNKTVGKQLRHSRKVRQARHNTDEMHRRVEQAQQQVRLCQQAEAAALQELQGAGRRKSHHEFSNVGDLFSTDQIADPEQSTPPWYLTQFADLGIYQEIRASLQRSWIHSARRRRTCALPTTTPFKSLLQPRGTRKKAKLELHIEQNRLDVLTKKIPDPEKAKYHRTVLEWLIFADESFANRLDMDVSPAPPEVPCTGNCHKAPNRKLHACDCSVRAAFIYMDSLDLGYDLKSERRRWHPEQFYACDIEERKAFFQMAEKVYKTVDGLWHRKRSGLRLA